MRSWAQKYGEAGQLMDDVDGQPTLLAVELEGGPVTENLAWWAVWRLVSYERSRRCMESAFKALI